MPTVGCGVESCRSNTTSSLRNDAVWKKQYVVPSRRRLLPAALPCILKASAHMMPGSSFTSCRQLAEHGSDDTVLDAHPVTLLHL